MFWRYLLGNILVKFQNIPYNPRGKQRLVMLIEQLFGSQIAVTDEGLKLRILPSSSMDAYYFRNDDSILPLKELIKDLSTNSVFIDIGANIGYFSLIASRQMQNKGLVISFEPSTRELRRLLENIDLNNASNIIVMSTGLGSENTIANLFISNHTGLNRFSEGIEGSKRHIQKQQPCAILKFDNISTLIEDRDVIDLVKIDVEGAELQVLRGMKSFLETKKIKKLFVEITPSFLNDFGDSREELFQYLDGYGYKPKFDKHCFQYDELFEILE